MNPAILVANAGVPMIFITLPAMGVALVPVIGLEAWLIRRRLAVGTWQTFQATAIANMTSTIVGIPLTWLALFACEMVLWSGLVALPIEQAHWDTPVGRVTAIILSAPWLGPIDNSQKWAVPLATLVLLLPFYVVSVIVERLVVGRMLGVHPSADLDAAEIHQKKVRSAVGEANTLTYGLLAVLTVAWLIKDIT